MLPRETSLGVAHQQHLPGARKLLQRGHRADHLRDLSRAAVIGAMPHRHATVTADPKAGLDLLEIGSAILWLAPLGRGNPSLHLVVDAIQRNRGHVPVQPGHINPEHRDRPRPTDPTIWSNSGAIASTARPIRSSLSASGAMPKTSSTAHSRAQSATRNSGRGLERRLATSASITCPWVTRATSLTGHARSTIPARSSRRQNSPTTEQTTQQLLHTGRRVGVADRTQAGRRAAHPQTLPHP